MHSDSIGKLYNNFFVLSEAESMMSEHEAEYLEILKAVKGTPEEKRLASQFIIRFYKYFPKLSEKAIDAYLDLCEDDDVKIRKQVIKNLPILCEENKKHTLKIADILSQLLLVQDASELEVVNNSILTLIKNDPKVAIREIFKIILFGEENIREKCIKFFQTKLKTSESDLLSKDIEEVIISECKKILQNVKEDEFHSIMEILSMTRLKKTVEGRQELVNIVADKTLTLLSTSGINLEQCRELIQCLQYVLPYFSSQVNSSKFVSHVSTKVLPHMSSFKIISSNESDVQLEILRLLAKIVEYSGKLEKPEEIMVKVYEALIVYMPQPEIEVTEKLKLQFRHVECLLLTFHTLYKQYTEFHIKQADSLKDLKLRLQYFGLLAQKYIKELKESISEKSPKKLEKEERQLRIIELKMTSNIISLIKDLFHTPPSFHKAIIPSWKNVLRKELESIESHKKLQATKSFKNTSSNYSYNRNVKTGFRRLTRDNSIHNNLINTAILNNKDTGKKNFKKHVGKNNFKNSIYIPPVGKYSSKIHQNRPKLQTNQNFFRRVVVRSHGFNKQDVEMKAPEKSVHIILRGYRKSYCFESDLLLRKFKN